MPDRPPTLWDDPLPSERELLGEDDCSARLLPRFLDPTYASSVFDRLLAEVKWTQEQLTLFGKQVLVPRETAWYGDPGRSYSYSGISNKALPWTTLLAELRDMVGAAATSTFNSVLLNHYRTGTDSVSWHSDDEPELGPSPTIASLTVGNARLFKLRRKDRHEVVEKVDLENGSLLIMSGRTQAIWEHQVPKTASAVGPRINLTFRRIT